MKSTIITPNVLRVRIWRSVFLELSRGATGTGEAEKKKTEDG